MPDLVLITRDDITAERSFGSLTDGALQLQILQPGSGPDLMPAGDFETAWRWSHKHGYPVPGVQGVPNHPNDEFHIGNDEQDTEGCTLVGETRGTDDRGLPAVLQSRTAFDAFAARRGLADYRSITSEQQFTAWQLANPVAAAPWITRVVDE